ncbi:MAG: mevalonate kinase, partial [Anaerolineae bacterium]|nr:mevalonate kinase [Anaerolineae bacterium]
MKTEAPGKIILFGEHAVVHGQPAIAVPLSAVRVTAEIEPAGCGGGVTVLAPDQNVTLHLIGASEKEDRLYNALAYPVEIALRALNIPMPDVCITIRSTIPIASGLGSGAAVAAALIRAVGIAVQRPFTNDTLNPLVYEVETRHHGTPSGIDNTVIVYEQPVYFMRGSGSATEQRPNTIEPFQITNPFTLLVADSGQSSPTHITVDDVGALYRADPNRIGALFARIGAITRAARATIEQKQGESGTLYTKLGALMDENHALLRELTVSSDELDHLCDAARAAGAHGAKLSGGGRGGNMIALVTPDK